MSLHIERGPHNKPHVINPILTPKGTNDYHKMFDQLCKQHIELIEGFQKEMSAHAEAKAFSLTMENNFRKAMDLLIDLENRLWITRNVKRKITSFLDRFNAE